MRVTAQFLRSKAKGPLGTTEYLDLSNSEIVAIEKLSNCPRLQTLILRGNQIFEVANLECCTQMWKVDLGNNAIKSLDGLSRFVALGTLNLANNDVTWHELGKIRHVHILNLSLHGNPQLEKDPYYRIHVIDCLPNVWMLDGRLITSAERLQVKHFFQDSALTEHPIRHKLSKEWFVPSNMKQIEVNGVFGDKATHVMTRFPTNGIHNIETDHRRLKYIAYNVQEDLLLAKKYTKQDFQVLKYRKCFIEDLLDVRPTDLERCNMLLLLLVTSLEFVMPTHLVKETLDIAKLSKLGKVYTMDLFLLPRDIRCLIVCILLAAVKIDKDGREDGGLYDKLYLCLFYTVSELTKLSQSSNTKQSAIKSKLNTLYSDYKCLLASEVVQLLCIVPAFFEYVAKDIGVMNLVVTATGDTTISEKIGRVSSAVADEGGEIKRLYEEVAELLLQKVQEHSLNISNRQTKLASSEEILNSTKALPMKNPSPALKLSDYHAKGITSPDFEPPRVLSAKKIAERNKKRFPHLGDLLLLGPQTLGKIVSLPQPFVALVSMDAVPVANGAMESKLKQSEDHYTYVNMDQLGWDLDLGLWKPVGAIGDRIDDPLESSLVREFLANHKLPRRLTMHTIEDLQKELERKAYVDDTTPRPNSPEWNPISPGRESSAPLIYSPRHPPTTPVEMPKPKEPRDPHRPMSSLLKEKLDLKLEVSKRPKSAGALLGSGGDAKPAAPPPPPPQQNKAPEKEEQSLPPKVINMEFNDSKVEQKECIHCAMEAAMAKDLQGEVHHGHHHPGHSHRTRHLSDEVVSAQSDGKDVSSSVVTVGDGDAEMSKDDKTELKEKSAKSEPPATQVLTGGTQIELNIPLDDSMDSSRSSRQPSTGRNTTRGRRPSSERKTATLTSPKFGPFSGKKTGAGRTRPFSAMDAYKYIVSHPIRPAGTENGYNTTYQIQRTEAWKQTMNAQQKGLDEVSDVIEDEDPMKVIIRHQVVNRGALEDPLPNAEQQNVDEGDRPPPPQRPSSPAQRTQSARPSSGSLNMTVGNHWLAGGRDLYWESVRRRPKSGHIPGWKDGLPDSMKRPKSAVASRTYYRRSRTTTPVTPSSMMYDSIMQGGYQSSANWSPLTDLSDYPPLHHQVAVPRTLGTPQHGTDCYNPPAQDMVYSNPPCTPQSRSPKPNYVSMQCIYEQKEEFESYGMDKQ